MVYRYCQLILWIFLFFLLSWRINFYWNIEYWFGFFSFGTLRWFSLYLWYLAIWFWWFCKFVFPKFRKLGHYFFKLFVTPSHIFLFQAGYMYVSPFDIVLWVSENSVHFFFWLFFSCFLRLDNFYRLIFKLPDSFVMSILLLSPCSDSKKMFTFSLLEFTFGF